MKRRDFLRNAGMAGAAVVGAAATSGSVAGEATAARKAAAATAAQASRARPKSKVIDWRCRPPLKPYRGLFSLRLNSIAKRPNTLANPATMASPAPSVSMVGKPGAMAEWIKELDAAGVNIAVTNGRYAAGLKELSMSSPELLELQNKYPNRLYGLAALNLDQPMEKTVAELEDALKKGLRGANIEPGYRSKNGGATTIDNADFYPIFETMIAADRPLMVQTGAYAGIYDWNEANEIWRFDAVMAKFPKLKMLLAHGGYPRQTEVLALALKHPSVTICPDVYMFWPGGQLYQQNLDLLQDQFVYGSAFPFASVKLSLEQTLKLPVSDKVMEKYLYGNAAALLKL